MPVIVGHLKHDVELAKADLKSSWLSYTLCFCLPQVERWTDVAETAASTIRKELLNQSGVCVTKFSKDDVEAAKKWVKSLCE